MYWHIAFNIEYAPGDRLWGPELYRGKTYGQLAFGFGALQLWLSWDRTRPTFGGN
jgi:hypothetical protein